MLAQCDLTDFFRHVIIGKLQQEEIKQYWLQKMSHLHIFSRCILELK